MKTHLDEMEKKHSIACSVIGLQTCGPAFGNLDFVRELYCARCRAKTIYRTKPCADGRLYSRRYL